MVSFCLYSFGWLVSGRSPTYRVLWCNTIHYFRNAGKFTCSHKAVNAGPLTHIHSTQTHTFQCVGMQKKTENCICSSSHMHTQGLSRLCQKQEDTNNTDQKQEHRTLIKHTSAMWVHTTCASGRQSNNCGRKTQKQTVPPPSSSPADRGQSFADCLALLFGTVCVSMSAFVRMHTSCHSWSLATPPTARPTAGCHWRVPAHSLTVWPECRGEAKTGPRAESASVNCHFLLSAYSLSCLFDPSTVYLCAYSPQKNPIFSTHLVLLLCSEQTNKTAG